MVCLMQTRSTIDIRQCESLRSGNAVVTCVCPAITTVQLKQFLRTRGAIIRSGVEREELLDMCERTLIDEAETDRAVRLYLTSYDDGAAEKRRRRQLIDVNILTPTNTPGLVTPASMSKSY